MVRTFQLTKALNRMTVMDNMMLGARDQQRRAPASAPFRPAWRRQEQEIEDKAKDLLDRFKLLEKKDDYAGSLSGGQRKLLEMARALMSDPKMIMLDEPMAGVNPALTQSLLGHIQCLRDEGMTVLFVEHDMHMVRHISDWVVVMAEGRVISEGRADEVMADPAVIDAYLGAHHDTDLGDDALLERRGAGADRRRGRRRGGRTRGRGRRDAPAEDEPSMSEQQAVGEQTASTRRSRRRGEGRGGGLPARASTSSTAATWWPTPAR